MRYEPPVDDPMSKNEVSFSGKAYNNQIELGTALRQAYKVRSVNDITSCNTCHR
jgi:hypothetical protein